MLTIPIKRRWYDMIRCGEKLEEYREPTHYWLCRFGSAFGRNVRDAQREGTEAWLRLRNGYNPESSTILIRAGIRIGQGRPEWGAETGKEYIILDIREVLEVKAVDSQRIDTGR